MCRSKILTFGLNQVYDKTNGQIKTFHDIAEFLISDKIKTPNKAIKKLADDYLRLEKKAKEGMKIRIKHGYVTRQRDELQLNTSKEHPAVIVE